MRARASRCGTLARNALLLAIALLTASAARVEAQLERTSAAAGARLEGYTFGAADDVDLDRVVLITVPVSVVVPLTRTVQLAVGGAYARAQLTRSDGREATLSGMTDTEVRITAALARDRVRVSIIGLVPTGASELSAEEMDVAGVIAADLLPFAISSWGTGGGVGMNAAFATPIGFGTALGVSAGYVVAREYEPIADTRFAYRPGNQLHVRAALDRTVGASGKASLSLAYLQYSADRSSGANIYQSGDRLQALASYAFTTGARGSGVVYAGYLRRQRGSYTNIVQLVPAQDLVYGGAALRYPLGSATLVPGIDVRVLGNEDGLEQGYTLSVGSSAELPFGPALIVPTARARFGNLTIRQGMESSFTGLELGLALRTRTETP